LEFTVRPVIEETSTITVTGQTTVPKTVRRVLGVDYGGKIAFRVERGRVTVHNPEAEHRDPALVAFLGLIEKDIASGRHIRDLPSALVTTMQRAMKDVEVDFNEPLESSAKGRRISKVTNITDRVCHYMLAHRQAHHGEVAAAVNANPRQVELLVKHWKQITGFLSARGKLHNARDYPALAVTRSDDRPRVWEHMLAHPNASATDVATTLKLSRGIVSPAVKFWKRITAFLEEQGELRTR
jgi:antitoxin PrlF